MAKSKNKWADLPDILTPEQVQAVLQISRSTFFRMVQSGQLPGAFKLGGAWRIDKDEMKKGLS